MKPVAPIRLSLFGLSCIALVCASSPARAQQQAPQQGINLVTQEAKARTVLLHKPTDSDVYCAGYISDKAPEKGLFVVTGEEGGLKQTYNERDIVFLSRGAGFIVNPGGGYILVRKLIDATKVDMFEGQTKMIKSLGTVWAEVGRIRIIGVHEHVASAQVTHSCMELSAGDIAIPLNAKPMPSAAIEGGYDRFAPPSGRNDGLIVVGKEYESILGAGAIGYLNIGAPQGVEVGQIYRIYRTYASSAADPNRRSLENTPHTALGMRQSYKLTPEQKSIMPRDILGEAVVLSVTGRSSTIMVTMAGAEIFPGDLVELKP